MGLEHHTIKDTFLNSSTIAFEPVSDADLSALQDLLDKSSSDDPYKKSAAYYAMTGRHGLWSIKSDDSAIIFCRHPNVVNEMLVFPPLGKAGDELLADTIHALQSVGEEVRLARFESAPSRMFGRKKEATEMVLDWRYPVHTLDTRVVTAMRGKRFQAVRTYLNGLKNADVTVRDLDCVSDRGAINNVLKKWSGDSEVMAPYARLLDLFGSTKMAGRLVFVDGQPSGFSIWEETDQQAGMANAFAHLAVHDVKGLSHFVMVDMCRTLSARGFSKVCIGGSETEGLDRFKRKFAPVASVALQSFVAVVAKRNHRVKPMPGVAALR